MPTLFWASSPARPNDTVMLTGSGLASCTAVQIARLADSTPTLLAAAAASSSDHEDLAHTAESDFPLPMPHMMGDVYAAVKPLSVSATTVQFVVPSTLTLGVFSVYVTAGTNSNTILVNAPQAIWFQAPRGLGLSAWQGETVRLFGRCFGSLNAAAEDAVADDIQSTFLPKPPQRITQANIEEETDDASVRLAHISTDTDINSAAAAPSFQQQQQPSLLHRAVRRLTGAPLAEDEDRSLGGASASASASGDLPVIQQQQGVNLEHPYIANVIEDQQHQQQQQQQQEIPTLDPEHLPQNQPHHSPLGRENWTLLDEQLHQRTPKQTDVDAGDAKEAADLWGISSVAKFTPTATSQGKAVIVALSNVTLLSATLTVPSSLAAGKWTLSIHNGYGGNTAWGTFTDQITIASPSNPWKTTVFNVTKLGLAEAIKQAGTNGGGIIQFDVGRYTFNTALTIPVNTVLKGAGMNATSLLWNYTGSAPPSNLFLGTGLYAARDMTIYLGGMFMNVFRVQPGVAGCYFTNIRIRGNPYMNAYVGPKPAPTNAHLKTMNAFSVSGTDISITGCDIYAPNFAFSFDGVQNATVTNNTLSFGGQGYAWSASKGIIFENNTINGNTFTSTGNGLSSISLTNPLKAIERIYYNQNVHTHYYGNNREMMTLDGAGGAYYGKVSSAKGTTITLSGDPAPQPPMPDAIAKNWIGGVMIIMSGTGTGQWRRVTASSGRTWTIASAFTVAPDTASIVLITFYRGDLLFVNNSFSDGGAVQLYGSSLNCVFMGNKGYRIGGFSSWGLNPKSWFWQPSYYNLFINNVIAEGNAWGTVTGAFFSIADASSPVPMVRFNVWRRNGISNNAAFSIGGPVEDSLFEFNTISNTPVAFLSNGSVGSYIVLRSNTLSSVPTLVNGPGATKFKKF